MKRCIFLLLISLMASLAAAPAMAADIGTKPLATQLNVTGQLLTPTIPKLNAAPVLVAFSAVPNRYTNVDPSTVFDLDGDLVGDILVGTNAVTGKNGTKLLLLSPAELNLDNVQSVPSIGYSTSAALQLSRVYVVQFPSGNYGKFILLQSTPKVTIWFNYGVATTSELKGDGTGGHATLTWGALPDADLGYYVYRYEVHDNSYTVTQLTDFTVQTTSFVDNTTKNIYYLYVVQSIKSGGTPGTVTTVAPVAIQSVQRKLLLPLTSTTAKLDGADLKLDAVPVIKDGLMMVPATVFSKIGANVTFDAAAGHLTIARRIGNVTYTVNMTVDDPDYTWNGTTYQTDVPPYKNGNVVMVPLRFLAPVLGYGVAFDHTTRTASLQWSE